MDADSPEAEARLQGGNVVMSKEPRSMDPEFLKILACPVCKRSLRWDEEASELVCEACRKAYPVEGDIPDLLPESGRELD